MKLKRRHFLRSSGLGALSLLLAPAVSLPQSQPPRNLPNIVIILGDDVGQGDLSCYNKDSRIPTPLMDRVAAGGVKFTDANSPSALCSPTRYGLLTGRYGEPGCRSPSCFRTIRP